MLRRPIRQQPMAQSVPAATAISVEPSAIQKLWWIEESQDSDPSRLA
ncbi:hypothetical protein [Dankookia sp. P2]